MQQTCVSQNPVFSTLLFRLIFILFSLLCKPYCLPFQLQLSLFNTNPFPSSLDFSLLCTDPDSSTFDPVTGLFYSLIPHLPLLHTTWIFPYLNNSFSTFITSSFVLFTSASLVHRITNSFSVQ